MAEGEQISSEVNGPTYVAFGIALGTRGFEMMITDDRRWHLRQRDGKICPMPTVKPVQMAAMNRFALDAMNKYFPEREEEDGA